MPSPKAIGNGTHKSRSIFALTSSFGLFLSLDRRLFVVFSLTNLSDNAVLSAASLEALQSGIQAFVLAYANFCQFVSLPLPSMTENSDVRANTPAVIVEAYAAPLSAAQSLASFRAPSLPFQVSAVIYITTKTIILYFFYFVNSFSEIF